MTFAEALDNYIELRSSVPSDEDVQALLDLIKRTDLEIPVLLAASGPMRRGEICALNSDHIKGNTVHVEFNMVNDDNGNWIIKRPKSYAGDRYIEFPDFVIAKLKNIDVPDQYIMERGG